MTKKLEATALEENAPDEGGVSRQDLRTALQQIMAKGQDALTRTPQALRDNVDTLTFALYRAITQPESEVRLTYKTVEETTCAWTWVVAACAKRGEMDPGKSSMFNVELRNGSGIVFKTETGDDRGV